MMWKKRREITQGGGERGGGGLWRDRRFVTRWSKTGVKDAGGRREE